MTLTVTEACFLWIRQATPDERRVYVEAGSRGPGMPVDLRSETYRRADVMKALGIRRWP